MKTRKFQIASVVVLGLALCAAWVLAVGCMEKGEMTTTDGQRVQPKTCLEESEGRFLRNGLTPPNDAAFDAMFFKHYGVNPFIYTDDDKLSTFAIDVDTGSYTVCRSYLNRGHVPPDEAARVEEFVNYFDYRYAPPKNDAFAIYLEGAPSKFGSNYHLLRIGIKGREISVEERKNANLVFVIDTSGSMQREDRLELVKKALRLLVNQLDRYDKIGIVEYGTRARKVLDPTSLEHKDRIISAIESLRADGSTNAEEGIVEGYKMADGIFEKGAINRVILCSDGVANVGRTGPESIFKRIEEMAKKGICLSAVGFGMGNYNDVLLEQLGDKGNGHYAYVDTLEEAKRVFVDNLTGTLQVIARDVKLQVDFNPEVVERYRLIGYENRRIADEEFREDEVGGGAVGAGQSATALYEIRFSKKANSGRVATLHIRHKDPETDKVTEVKREIGTQDFAKSFEAASTEFRLAAGIAEFAEILRKSYWADKGKYADVFPVIRQALRERQEDRDIIELLNLIAKAGDISPDEVVVKKDYIPKWGIE